MVLFNLAHWQLYEWLLLREGIDVVFRMRFVHVPLAAETPMDDPLLSKTSAHTSRRIHGMRCQPHKCLGVALVLEGLGHS